MTSVIVDSSPSITIERPWMPPGHDSSPRTTRAPGVNACWLAVCKRHSAGITGAMKISISPPDGFFHRKSYRPPP